MADTLKFGPEWLRTLSDGNTVASPPPTPSLGKFKLADYRYGREEMLALFQEKYETPENLFDCPPVHAEETQKPLALIPLSEEEQRLMSQSVNSMTVLRGMGRGGPPVRGRGISDRGRGRGRGRGEGYLSRGMSLENGETGGFGRPPPRGTNKDGWEEVGKKFDRGFAMRNQEEGIPPVRREYARSLSNENWREKEEDDDGDWRRVGIKDRWGAKGNWRDPNVRAGFDQERKINGQYKERMRGDDDKSVMLRPSRSHESWDTDDVPEWSVTGDEDMDGLGTFDASGQFVTTDFKDDERDKDGREDKTVLPPEKNTSNTSAKPDKLLSKDEKSSKGINLPDNEDKLSTKENSPKEQRKECAKKTKLIKENGSSPESANKQSESPEPKKVEKKKLKTEKQTAQPVKKLSSDNSKPDSPVLNKKPALDSSNAKPAAGNSAAKTTKRTSPKSEEKSSPAEREVLDRLAKEAENLVANESNKGKKSNTADESVPVSAEVAMKWFYRDPQGDTQGPFNPEEMAQWFSAGYFTMNLLVKRGCDERFQQLGELIKRWGRVPFLGGPSPPPLLNNPVSSGGTESAVKSPSPQPVPAQPTPIQSVPPMSNQLGMLQQQFVMQQFLQQQLVMRQMTMQMMTEMQEQESFKSLPLAQQQQLATQMLMQTQPLLFQQLQQMQQQQQTERLSPQTTTSESSSLPSQPTFHRSTSQPAGDTQDTQNLSGSWSQPSSVWDLEQPKPSISPNHLLSQMEAQRNLQEDEEQRRKVEEFQRAQEEIQRQQEELKLQRELMMREKEELERQKQMEIKRLEEAHQKEELRKRLEQQEIERQQKEAAARILQAEMENRRREEEERHRHEQEERHRHEQEERQRREQEERHRHEQEERQRREQEERQRLEMEKAKRIDAERRIQEAKRQMEEAEERERREEMLRQQRQREEFLIQQELQQAAAEEEKQRQIEIQRQVQLPPTAKWAENDHKCKPKSSMSLAEIQEQEELERQEKNRRQMELQQQQQQMLFQQQQQQQQQQKSWANHMQTQLGDGLKTLLEIQAEQEMQLEHDRKKRKPHQQQPRQAKVKQTTETTTFGTWTSQPTPAQSGWGDNSIWSSEKSTGLGFWDDAIISTSKKAPNKSRDQGEFPALGNKKQVQNQKSSNRSKPKSNVKEEEVVQRLFQSSRPADDFTQWCEKALSNMTSSVDVPTFIAFLQDVESPYEVHDYVKSYLGESKQTSDFARLFLEKRSHYKNKARLEKQQEEDSIWGPAPAVNPKETRSALTDMEKAKGKKKKRMQKIDQSILGFTVHASQNRVNAGEIDPAD